MYFDHTPKPDGQALSDEFWTVALVSPAEENLPQREVHFGVFTFDDAIEAIDSGKVRVMADQTLSLRRIRRFPV